MFRLFAFLTLSASLCDAVLLSTELSCPKGGYITREKYCAETPGCENGEDSDTIYPRGPCIKVGDKHVNYRFSCGSKGEVVPLTAMCNGSVECTNGKDETHAFCPYNSERERRTAGGGSCKPKCKNGGKCRSRSNKCICSDFWTGDRCETPVCFPSCGNGGTCTRNNKCFCAPGWKGSHCQESTCTPPCANGGTCRNDTCICPCGWIGDLCETPECKLGCQNGGSCTAPDTCQCASGWSGDHCDTPVCAPECQNGGNCTGPNTCECRSSWTGNHCELPVCVPGCVDMAESQVAPPPVESATNSCTFGCGSNNSYIGPSRCICHCAPGWSGPQCDIPSCDPPCEDGKICKGPNTCEFPNGAGGDPHFLVNLPDNSNLCFSLQGEPGFAFNLVTSEILVINAVFIDAPPRLQDWTTVIGEIGVLYYTKSRSVLKIHFKFKDKSIYVSGYGVLDAKRVSSVALKGEQLEVANSGNVTYTWASTVLVSIGDELTFKVFFNHDNLDIVWSDVSSFNHSSHGILGQFFNKGTKVDKEKRQLVLPKRSPIPVTLEDPKPEVHHKSQCWRPQTPGYQGERLLEGDYLDYVVGNVFATNYMYSMVS